MTWDFQEGKWQVMRWKTNLPQEMGRPRWEVAGNEMGRRIYHRRWDVQDGEWQVMRWEEFGKWQVMRWEDEFTKGDGTSKIQDGKWQVMRWEEFTT